MNVETYLAKLNALNPLSVGLQSYLKTIAEIIICQKGQKLYTSETASYFFPLLLSGAVKINCFACKNRIGLLQELTYSPNDFVNHLCCLGAFSEHKFYLEIMEDCEIMGISEKHYASILKHFPDAYKLGLKFSELHYMHLLNIINDNKHL